MHYSLLIESTPPPLDDVSYTQHDDLGPGKFLANLSNTPTNFAIHNFAYHSMHWHAISVHSTDSFTQNCIPVLPFTANFANPLRILGQPTSR